MPVTKKEIDDALARELRPWVRKRLVTIRAVMKGESVADAALTIGASRTGVHKWLRQARQGGCAALLRDGRSERPKPRMMAAQEIAVMQREIEIALQSPLSPKLKIRLTAVHTALSGQIDAGATSADVHPRTVNEWLRKLRCEGVDHFLQKNRRAARNLRGHLTQLHALANAEKNLNIRKRILALSYVATGMPIEDAAIAARLSPTTVYAATRRFQREGIAAFRNKPPPGRRARLGQAQLKSVASIVHDNPAMTLRALRAYIRAEFGVRYTSAGLQNMLKKQLGIVYGAAAFRPTHRRRIDQRAKPRRARQWT